MHCFFGSPILQKSRYRGLKRRMLYSEDVFHVSEALLSCKGENMRKPF